MFLKPPKPRQFKYRPKFYTPQEEVEEGPRIKFRRHNSLKSPPKKSTLLMLLVAIVLAVMLGWWLKIDQADDSDFKFEQIDIGEIK